MKLQNPRHPHYSVSTVRNKVVATLPLEALQQYFRKQKLLNIKCVFLFSLQLLSETFLTLRRIWRDIILHTHWSSCKVPLLLSAFD
jgi:hypothetical protein